MRLLSLLLLSTLATILLSAAILVRAPGAFDQKALWVGLAVPLIWLGFMLYAYWDAKGWRTAVVPLLGSVVGAAIVFTSAAPQI